MIAESEQSACMTVLDGRNERLAIRIIDISRRLMRIACAADLALGAPVRIEWRNHIILAEVVRTDAAESRTLHIRHSIRTEDLTWIARLWE